MGAKSIKLDNHAALNFDKNNLFIGYLTMAFCCLFFTQLVFAEQYQLELAVDLSGYNDLSEEAIWLAPLTSPESDDVFFVAKNNGLIYLVSNKESNTQSPILNMPQQLNNATFISLTAISLHPSFTLPEETGYATFYTAHTTEFTHQNNINRLTPIESNVNFAFETVITEWRYNFETKKIDPLSQREVIRIPIQHIEHAIQQLAFDPYLKPWNVDFGQLYFSLGFSDELKEHSLYSGVILRIYPQIFGARNYTVSERNPFVKTPEINDEIAIMDGQNIKHFFWAKYSHNTIFIQHNNEIQYWLSKAKVGAKLDSLPLTDLLKQQANKMPSLLLYQGRNFHGLRNKIVYFTQLGEQLNLTSHILESTDNELPINEKIITTDNLSSRSDLSIHEDNHHEIIIFDRPKNKLYSLQSTNSNAISDNQSPTTDAPNESIHYVLYSALMVILLFVIFFIKKRKTGVRSLASNELINDYVRFEYVLTKDAILLFRMHSKKPHKTLQLSDITRCEVLLNNNVICSIDYEPANVISNQIEAQIRSLFTTEENEIILEEQTRQIQIILFDRNDSYPICLYLRHGNSRVTGEKYYRVVDMVIDLCWVISKQLNPQETETRIAPIVTITRPNLLVTSAENTKEKSDSATDENQANTTHQNTMPDAPQSSGPLPPPSDLVNALDKLVNLHKQGYLSDEEFNLAKSNLLR